MPPLATIGTDLSVHYSKPFVRHSLPRRAISAPEPNFILKIFRSIANISFIGEYLSHIINTWRWIQPRHIINTAIAQAKVDQEYWEEQTAIFERKEKLAERRARRLLATENPELFLKAYVVSKAEGSPERRQMLALLRKYRPDFYELWKRRGGEALEEEEQEEDPAEEVEEANEVPKEDQAKGQDGIMEEVPNENQGQKEAAVIERAHGVQKQDQGQGQHAVTEEAPNASIH